jgi:HSP20 family protein
MAARRPSTSTSVFNGRFRRVISLSDDVDPNGVSAAYRDGILHITAKRRASAQPRRISVQ